MLAKLEQLGVVPSSGRPRVSDDDPFPEALFSPLKYRPNYPGRPFVTLDDARRWVTTFVAWSHATLRSLTARSRSISRSA
jgi:hypothetical protein